MEESTETGASVYVYVWIVRVLLSARFGTVFVSCLSSTRLSFPFGPLNNNASNYALSSIKGLLGYLDAKPLLTTSTQ